jgi:N-acyl homoserine lactone hydrolase
MKLRSISWLVLGACATTPDYAATTAAPPAPAARVTFEPKAPLGIIRLDCGGPNEPVDVSAFSDTRAFDGKKVPLIGSCYLVQHGTEYLLWDTGVLPAAKDAAGRPYVKITIAAQLATLGVRAEQITYVAISHHHADHTGQAAGFAHATLLIGERDWATLSAPREPSGGEVAPSPVAPWLEGKGGKVEQISHDKDVFGDGSVIMLATAGHTLGHHSLLVRLRETGPVILSGDLAVCREAYELGEVPTFAEDRAATLAAFDRVKRLAANLRATLIIQHEPRDVAKLPAFPAIAR